MSEVITFQIQALDEYTRMPIANAKLQLQNINLGQNPQTNSQGLATFEIDSKQNLKSFRAKLIHKDYQEYPVLDRSIILNSIKRREKPLELRFKQKLDNFAVKEVKLEPRTYTLTDAHNEVITKNFYKVGDTLTLKASFDENKVKENEIKWAYKVMKLDEIQMFHQQDSKDKNPQSTQTHYFQLDEIPNDTLQILQDSKTFFSNTPASTIKNTKSNESEPNNIYKGKTLEITIPENFENEKKLIALFAYKNEPNWKVCQIIRLNDYPQITIDCTLAETLRANAKNDEISRLGWGVSYICQRLWHDNPANAKELGELIYIDSRQEDFIDSIPNATMQTIVKDILPRVEMREFDKKYKKIAEESHREYQKMYREFEAQKERYTFAKEDDKDKTIGLSQKGDMINFYIELDWDEFYMQFPLMRGLEKEMLHIQIEPIYIQTTGMPTGKYKNQSKILTLNFLHSMQSFMCSKSDILYQALHNKTASNMQVVANLNAIASNPKGAKMPKSISKNIDSKTHTITALDIEYEDINHTIFSIKANDMSLAQAQKDMDSLTPKDLMRHHMQYYSISDIDFGLEYKLSFEEKSNQAIALYALSGKFQIYYVLDSFEVERINDKEIAIYPTQIKAYVDDSFDFRDQDHTFNDDGSIAELGQPVGAWNYKEMRFDRDVSESQMNKYAEKSGTFSATNVGAAIFLKSAISIDKYENYKRQNIYPIYNHDYQQTQKNFNLGLDFLVTSPTFKDIKIPKDLDTKSVFKIIVRLGG